jgi:hypothetical protein
MYSFMPSLFFTPLHSLNTAQQRRNMFEGGKQNVQHASDKVQDRAAAANDSMRSAAHDVSDQASNAAADLKQRAQVGKPWVLIGMSRFRCAFGRHNSNLTAFNSLLLICVCDNLRARLTRSPVTWSRRETVRHTTWRRVLTRRAQPWVMLRPRLHTTQTIWWVVCRRLGSRPLTTCALGLSPHRKPQAMLGSRSSRRPHQRLR